MTTRLLTLLLIPLMAVVVACGSDEPLQPASASTDASQLLRDTLANSAELKSGVLSASLRATADGLRAGQFIITGSLTAPMMLDADDKGIDFALEPIGSVSVKFSG